MLKGKTVTEQKKLTISSILSNLSQNEYEGSISHTSIFISGYTTTCTYYFVTFRALCKILPIDIRRNDSDITSGIYIIAQKSLLELTKRWILEIISSVEHDTNNFANKKANNHSEITNFKHAQIVRWQKELLKLDPFYDYKAQRKLLKEYIKFSHLIFQKGFRGK